MRKILGTALLALALVACAESVEVSVVLEDEPEFEIERARYPYVRSNGMNPQVARGTPYAYARRRTSNQRDQPARSR